MEIALQFLILENKVNEIHNNKTTISSTSYYALVSRQLKIQFSNFRKIVSATLQAEMQTNPAAAIVVKKVFPSRKYTYFLNGLFQILVSGLLSEM